MRHHLTAAALVCGLALAAPTLAAAQDATPEWLTTPRDWSAALTADATALHDIVIDNHPGVHDPLNPAFKARVDAGLALALERARTTTDGGGYWWALRAYAASFEDGHLGIGLMVPGGLPARWPGFLTVYHGVDQVVADRDETDAATPPLGSRLVDCDGVAAEPLAAARIGEFRGRWFLESQRAEFGEWMFMNASNPWTPEMAECRFRVGDETRTFALNWRPIATADLSERRIRIAGRATTAFGTMHLDDGGYWLSMPSFDGTPGTDPHRELTAMIEPVKADPMAMRAAPYVVFDLRGNDGGSSHWSRELAQALWGEAWLEAHDLAPVEAIEWRASEDNLATIQAYLTGWTAAGESAERIAWARGVVDGMTAARAEGRPYYRSADAPAAEGVRPAVPAPLLVHGPVYVLTDPACASACLDAVDLWKAMGAIQIGRETSADTVYMDVRNAVLPSRLARLTLPMKVWRGRVRGNNEPQRPTHLFDGDMSDDAALRAWVRGL